MSVGSFVATLIKERDALRARCAELYEANNQCNAAHTQTLKERDALRAEVERLQKSAARYERLRRLNPRQFANLCERNLNSCPRIPPARP